MINSGCKLVLGILFHITFLVCNGQVYTPETVPNTKPVDNSNVSNPDKLLLPSTVERNGMLVKLERRALKQKSVSRVVRDLIS